MIHSIRSNLIDLIPIPIHFQTDWFDWSWIVQNESMDVSRISHNVHCSTIWNRFGHVESLTIRYIYVFIWRYSYDSEIGNECCYTQHSSHSHCSQLKNIFLFSFPFFFSLNIYISISNNITNNKYTLHVEHFDPFPYHKMYISNGKKKICLPFIDNRRMSERDINRFGGADGKLLLPAHGQPLPNSKSVPTLHHVSGNISKWKQKIIINILFVESNMLIDVECW